MGVPRLFRTLTQKYRDLLSDKLRVKPSHLFFDLNCLIHPVCAECTRDPNLCGTAHGKKKMFQAIVDYIVKVVDFVNPAAYVYLFMDGVAPFAKIQQQRQRRYKSLYLKKKRMQLEKKDTKDCDFWDSNIISPGTSFMNELADFLRIMFPHYLVSDTNEPGEGEHKILEYIFSPSFARHSSSGDPQKNTICIYGLDADLIILSWIVQLKKGIPVFLVRETLQMRPQAEQSESPFTFMNIEQLMDGYYRDLGTLQNKRQECVDFVFLCFFLGNDFLPNLFGIQLGTRPDGLYLILENYKHCKRNIENFYLVSDSVLQDTSPEGHINWTHVAIFIDLLKRQTMKINQCFLKWYMDFRPKKLESSDPVEIMMHDFEHHRQKTDPVRLTEPGWESRFVLRYFGLRSAAYGIEAHYVTGQYMSGLIWNTCYYFKTRGRLSFGYLYPYYVSPTLEMISEFLCRHLQNPTPTKNTMILPATQQELYIWPKLEELYNLFVLSPFVPVEPLPTQKALALILPPESFSRIVEKKSPADFKEMSEGLLNRSFNIDYKHYWNECHMLFDPIEWQTN